jgi:hypothetical protein
MSWASGAWLRDMATSSCYAFLVARTFACDPTPLLKRAAVACAVLLLVPTKVVVVDAPGGLDNDHRRRIYFLESLAPTQPAALRTIEGFEKRPLRNAALLAAVNDARTHARS